MLNQYFVESVTNMFQYYILGSTIHYLVVSQ